MTVTNTEVGINMQQNTMQINLVKESTFLKNKTRAKLQQTSAEF